MQGGGWEALGDTLTGLEAGSRVVHVPLGVRCSIFLTPSFPDKYIARCVGRSIFGSPAFGTSMYGVHTAVYTFFYMTFTRCRPRTALLINLSTNSRTTRVCASSAAMA